jgi:ABC-type branched-subunit amino acid transport system substrate-binding protein
MLNPAKLNVIVLPSNNQSYVTEFISKLNSLRDKNKIVVFGLQSWISYDNLDFDYLNNLSLHVPANNYIDYQNSAAQNFIKSYRDKYKTEPEMYAFQGFDVTSYFISSLQKYGTGFLKNIADEKYQGIETHFNFMRYPSNSGFENKFVYILKYQDNKLVKAN